MTGALLTAELHAEQWFAALTRAQQALGRPEPLLRAIGTGLLAAAHRRFDTGVDPQGQPWAPLNPAYAAAKSNHLILVESGLLRRLSMSTGAMSVQIGTNRVYGAIHQFGGTITAKSSKGLRFRIGGQWVRAHSVVMPARPYLGWGPAEQVVVEDAFAAVMGGALDGLRRV